MIEVGAVTTSSSVAGTGDMWCEAWNMLKWYILEFWNQTANQETNKNPRSLSSTRQVNKLLQVAHYYFYKNPSQEKEHSGHLVCQSETELTFV